MKKLDGKSFDIVKENVNKLKEIFPEIFCEDKIDFKRLEEVLGNYIDDSEEKYSFTWHGKSKAIKLAQTPTTGTLRPAKEESKNWDKTENLYIEGDNLEVLKLFQKTYNNKVKMIYIDPPYNTGNDFVYPDDYSDNLENYLAITEQVDGAGRKVATNTESGGRYHTNWLNMMYPRLRLARNLLRDDGVIFISIDDTEVANLRKVCDEIFGEDNFIANVVWQKKYSPQNDAKYFSDMHDHILCYAKMKRTNDSDEGLVITLLPRTDEQNNRYKNIDHDPRGPWKSSDLSVKTYSANYDYPITTPSGRVVNPPSGRCWRTSKENLLKLIQDNRVWFGEDGNNVPSIKRFLSEVKNGRVPTTWWNRDEFGDNQKARQEIKDIFITTVPFDTPKPIILLKNIIRIGTMQKDNIVLDFFSGSSTTAHAVMQLNEEDQGNRKFIMVQLPEPTDEKSEAYKAGYKNICEIGKERIRRAGDKIVEENKNKEGIEDLDIGFKVFKLDSSNIKKWNPDYDNLEQSLEDIVNNFVPDRTEEDVVYEIMLKYGIDLTCPVETREICGEKVFSVGFGALIICMDNDITLEVVNGIVNLINELNPEIKRVVFKDNGFKNDSVKANAIEILKRNNVKEIMSI